jgi:hypothetical protein
MKKVFPVLVVISSIFFIISCTKPVIGDKIWEDQKNNHIEYTWMTDSGKNIDRYSLFVFDSGKTTLYIARFDEFLSETTAEKVEEHNVKIQNIERINGRIVSITMDYIKYKTND